VVLFLVAPLRCTTIAAVRSCYFAALDGTSKLTALLHDPRPDDSLCAVAELLCFAFLAFFASFAVKDFLRVSRASAVKIGFLIAA
jgi:hypothetical protein